MDFGWVSESVRYIYPELVLVCGVVALTILSLFRRLNRSFHLCFVLLMFVAAGFLTYCDFRSFEGNRVLFKGALSFDKYSLFFKFLFISISFITAIFSYQVIKKWTSGFVEFFILLLCATIGMIFMSSSRNFLMMFLNLEFVSITSYIMTGLLRRNIKSVEASLKYIIYGAGSSGIMLFGISYLYGITGSIDVYEVGSRLSEMNVPSVIYLIVSVLILAGFAYKMSVVPFHMWCPDVYEGAPTPVTAFFSTGPKIAGFAMMIRFVHGVFGKTGSPFQWELIFFIIAVLSIVIGNLVALHQDNLKRLMAYSGIAHAGYMALIFLGFSQDTVGSLLFYSLVYTLMNLGAFIFIIILERYHGVETIPSLTGYGYAHPIMAASMSVFMFSLVGLPPLAGFFGKYVVFAYIINEFSMLAIASVVIAVIFSVVSLFYYARVVGAMFLKEGGAFEPHRSVPFSLSFMVVLSSITVLMFFVVFRSDWIFTLCRSCAL